MRTRSCYIVTICPQLEFVTRNHLTDEKIALTFEKSFHMEEDAIKVAEKYRMLGIHADVVYSETTEVEI